MYAFAALLVLAVVVSGQRPDPCETPKVWEGRLFQVDHTKNFSVLGKLSYDALNERVRLIEDVDIAGKRSFYDFIILYREQLVYRVELSINGTGKCVVSEFKEPFRPLEIPRNATFATEAYIGASLPEVGVLVNIFYGQATGRQGETVDYVATVTSEGCIPVSEVLYTKRTGAIHSSFFDIVLGIEDPERFVPPKSCDHAEHLPRVPFHH